MVHGDVRRGVLVALLVGNRWREAVVRPRSGHAVGEEELLSWLEPRVAGFKRPKSIDFVTEELPENATATLHRRAVSGRCRVGGERRVR